MDIDGAARIPLGIGSMTGRALSLFFRHFGIFFLVAFVPSLILAMLGPIVIGNAMEAGISGQDPFAMFTPAYLIWSLISFMVVFLITAVVTLTCYDVVAGVPVAVGQHLGRTLRHLVPLIVLSVAFILMFYVGLIFLVVPGLYLGARYWVMTPAMLVEPAGWRALGRASTLSRSYRWPIVVYLLILVALIVAVSLAMQLVLALIVTGGANLGASFAPGGLAGLNLFLLGALSAVSSAIIYALSGVFTAVLYARLREIKEGVGMGDLREVFA